jgi:hypothetical protein
MTVLVDIPLVAPEAPARRTLLDQIAKLESDLAAQVCSAWPNAAAAADAAEITRTPGGRTAGPRLLSLAELEHTRDALAARLGQVRTRQAVRADDENAARRRIEEMLLDPAAHRFEIVTNADIGEPGCKSWHVRPRLGLVGMLMGWWRVVVSSGCPLASPPRDLSSAQPPSSPASARPGA